jgi:hypothetical protein
MSTDETPKSKESEAAENLESEMEQRDENRLVGERAQRQDLTQGMDTGTHDSTHRGVNWAPEFSVHTEPAKPKEAPEEAPEKGKGTSA